MSLTPSKSALETKASSNSFTFLKQSLYMLQVILTGQHVCSYFDLRASMVVHISHWLIQIHYILIQRKGILNNLVCTETNLHWKRDLQTWKSVDRTQSGTRKLKTKSKLILSLPILKYHGKLSSILSALRPVSIVIRIGVGKLKLMEISELRMDSNHEIQDSVVKGIKTSLVLQKDALRI